MDSSKDQCKVTIIISLNLEIMRTISKKIKTMKIKIIMITLITMITIITKTTRTTTIIITSNNQTLET